MSEITEKAIKRLEDEQGKVKGQKEKAVLKEVVHQLSEFCKNEEFAKRIVDTDKTLNDCLKKVLEKSGNSISDFEVYSGAVKFYFPDADVKFEIKLTMPDTKRISLNLEDFI